MSTNEQSGSTHAHSLEETPVTAPATDNLIMQGVSSATSENQQETVTAITPDAAEPSEPIAPIRSNLQMPASETDQEIRQATVPMRRHGVSIPVVILLIAIVLALGVLIGVLIAGGVNLGSVESPEHTGTPSAVKTDDVLPPASNEDVTQDEQPTEASANRRADIANAQWVNGEFVLYDKSYKCMESTVGELLENGWQLSSAYDEKIDAEGHWFLNGTSDSWVGGSDGEATDLASFIGSRPTGRQASFSLTYRDTNVQVDVAADNLTDTAQDYTQCVIANIEVGSLSAKAAPIFAGGGYLGMSKEDLTAAYGELEGPGDTTDSMNFFENRSAGSYGFLCEYGHTRQAEYRMFENGECHASIAFWFDEETDTVSKISYCFDDFRDKNEVDDTEVERRSALVTSNHEHGDWVVTSYGTVIPPHREGTASEGQAPSEIWTDGEFELNGSLYRVFESTISDFFANGWEQYLGNTPLSACYDSQGQCILNPNERLGMTLILSHGDVPEDYWSIRVTIANLDRISKNYDDCVLVAASTNGYTFSMGDYDRLLRNSHIILSKGIQSGISTRDDIIAAYGEPDEISEDSIVYYAYPDKPETQNSNTITFGKSFKTVEKSSLEADYYARMSFSFENGVLTTLDYVF